MKEKPQEFKQFIKEKVEAQKPIGKGTEKIVYPHPDKSDKVIGVYRYGNYSEGDTDQYFRRLNKSEFYLIKILHMLFPDNFADISMVTTEPRTTTREKVNAKREWFGLMEDTVSSEDIKKIEQDMLDLGIFVDTYNKNYIKNKKSGYAVYVDGFEPSRGINIERLRSLISEKLTDSNQERALKYLDRLDKLINNF